METKERPILNVDQQIEHLRSKGIKFEKISEQEAKRYLQENNNYFKLRAYRKNFPKHPDGPLAGQYIDLDFAMLKDLAIIDMHLRYVLIHLALDVEHFAKIKLLRMVEESGEDGYQIVMDYMDDLKQRDEKKDTHRLDALKQELLRNLDNPYCGGIVSKYDGHYPVWAFLEIIPLGTLIHFYGFCADQLGDKRMKNEFYLLRGVKELRNAAAHSNCIIHDMGARDSQYKTNYGVLNALHSISKETRNRRLSNARMQQVVTLLYAHSILVTSQGVHDMEGQALHELSERMLRHSDYYANNELILSNFKFLQKVIDIFFPEA